MEPKGTELTHEINSLPRVWAHGSTARYAEICRCWIEINLREAAGQTSDHQSGGQLRPLKTALLDVYGHFADRRIKNIDTGNRFIVDGRTNADIAADRNVYGWFCSMFLNVDAADQVTLTMLNVPSSQSVSKWFDTHAQPKGQDGYTITIEKGEEAILAELAVLMAAITAKGNRYDVPHYKYSVPRVVDSLKKLKDGLNVGWHEA